MLILSNYTTYSQNTKETESRLDSITNSIKTELITCKKWSNNLSDAFRGLQEVVNLERQLGDRKDTTIIQLTDLLVEKEKITAKDAKKIKRLELKDKNAKKRNLNSSLITGVSSGVFGMGIVTIIYTLSKQ